MKEVAHLATEFVERAVEACVERIVLLQQLFDERFPESIHLHLGVAFAAAGQRALFQEQLVINLRQIVGRLPRFAGH